jgi:HEAT repeat protein
MEPRLSLVAQTALVGGSITLALAALTLVLQALLRRRVRSLERRVTALALDYTRFLTGALRADLLRATVAASPAAVVWGALERFADNIAGEEWARLSWEFESLAHVALERRALLRAAPWRRTIAARRLGMLDLPACRQALEASLDSSPPAVRLRVLLSLARLREPSGLRWLLLHPETLEGVAPTIAVAVLKRFGPSFAGAIRPSILPAEARGALVVAAAEVLGVWRDRPSRAPLEHLLDSQGLEERIAAARALGHLGERASAPRLITALADPAWQVRAQAARALGRMPAPEAVAALERVTRDLSWWVRRNACYALVAHGTAGFATLTSIAHSDRDRYAREMAIEALQALAWDTASPGGIVRVG